MLGYLGQIQAMEVSLRPSNNPTTYFPNVFVWIEPMYPPYLHGILVGFFFPLMPMFFLREVPPPAFFSDNVAQIEAPRSVVFS